MAEARSHHGCSESSRQCGPGPVAAGFPPWAKTGCGGAAWSLAAGYWLAVLSLRSFTLLTCLPWSHRAHWSEQASSHGNSEHAFWPAPPPGSGRWWPWSAAGRRPYRGAAGSRARGAGRGPGRAGRGGAGRGGRRALNQEPPSLESSSGRHSQLPPSVRRARPQSILNHYALVPLSTKILDGWWN